MVDEFATPKPTPTAPKLATQKVASITEGSTTSYIVLNELKKTMQIVPHTKAGPTAEVVATPTFTSLQAYSVFCTIRYLSTNDPNDKLTLTEKSIVNKTGISTNFVEDIIEELISNELFQYADTAQINISLTKKGEDIRNINSFSHYFP